MTISLGSFTRRVRPWDVFTSIAIVGVLAFAVAWAPTDAASGPSGLVTQTPVRVLDTRSGPMPAGGAELVVNTGRPGSSAVVANITSVDTQCCGQFLTAWPSGPRPDTSVLNAAPGQTIANSVIVPVAPDGTFRLYTFASAHLLVDISGYFDGGSALPEFGDEFPRPYLGLQFGYLGLEFGDALLVGGHQA